MYHRKAKVEKRSNESCMNAMVLTKENDYLSKKKILLDTLTQICACAVKSVEISKTIQYLFTSVSHLNRKKLNLKTSSDFSILDPFHLIWSRAVNMNDDRQ